MAWLADGGDLQAVCAKREVLQTLAPEPDARARLLERHDRFTRLYPALRERFRDAG